MALSQSIKWAMYSHVKYFMCYIILRPWTRGFQTCRNSSSTLICCGYMSFRKRQKGHKELLAERDEHIKILDDLFKRRGENNENVDEEVIFSRQVYRFVSLKEKLDFLATYK